MADLIQARESLRGLLKEYSKPIDKTISPDEAMKNEAVYAASGLQDENPINRVKAVEFLEILSDNPYAQEYLLQCLEDAESSVVHKAVSALGKVGNADIIPRLQTFLSQTKSRQLQSEISRIVNKLDKDHH